MSTADELEDRPIFIVNLFATHSDPPTSLQEVQERMLEISLKAAFSSPMPTRTEV